MLAPGNEALRDRIDDILRDAMRDGTLEAIFRKWKVWNDDQPQLFAQVLAGESIAPVTGYQTDSTAALSKWEATRRYLPSLLRAAAITLVLSCVAMALAVALGVGDRDRPRLRRTARAMALTGYVELMRGTPLLLQLFVLYYGLAAAIRLPAFVAALLGLALNYAAYESEIYRGALEAVPADSSRPRARSASANGRC